MTIKQIGGVFGRNPEFNDVEVTGALDLHDGVVASFGDNKDFQIVHNGSHTYLTDGGDGNVYFSTNSQFNVGGTDGKIGIQFNSGVNVALRHNNVLKFSTASEGAAVYGNLIMATAGGGIDFSATAGTGTSELFDDYEEGTWTPAVIGTTTVGVGTYSVQSGVYTKVGNKVLFEAQLTWSAHTGTGNMRVSGLPFTNGAGFSSSCLVLPNGITVTAGAQVGANVSATTIVLYNVDAGGLALLALDTAGSLTLSGQYSV